MKVEGVDGGESRAVKYQHVEGCFVMDNIIRDYVYKITTATINSIRIFSVVGRSKDLYRYSFALFFYTFDLKRKIEK